MSGIACLPNAKDTEPSAQKIRVLTQSYDAKGLMRHLVEAFQEKLQVSSPGKLSGEVLVSVAGWFTGLALKRWHSFDESV